MEAALPAATKRTPLRFLHELPYLLVCGFSLFLLLYVGFAETQIRLLEFQQGKLEAQADALTADFDAYLNAGLPLQQFSRFDAISESLLRSDPDLNRVWVTDNSGKVLFSVYGKTSDTLSARTSADPQNNRLRSLIRMLTLGNEKAAQDEEIRIARPLKNRFGQVGMLFIQEDKDTTEGFFRQYFRLPLNVAGILMAVLALITLLVTNVGERRQSVANTSFVLSFLIMAAAMGYTVFNVYDKGAREEAGALASLLAQRLESVSLHGLKMEDLSGIERVLKDFKQSNSYIGNIAITRGSVADFHTDPEKVGQLLTQPHDVIRIETPLRGTEQGFGVFGQDIQIDFDRDIVMSKVQRSAGTFIVLFIACLLFTIIMIEAGTVSSARASSAQAMASSVFVDSLKLVKPAYFMVVFVGAMSASFFPQLVDQLASEQQVSWASSSLPFTLYYLAFAIILLPAGRYAEGGKTKQLMIYGFVAECFGRGVIALYGSYWMIIGGSVISGVGQGMFLIGLQTYLLMVTPPAQRTRGAAVKVIGRNSGLIAGTAIGALLYSYLDYRQLFMLAALISFVSLLYVLLVVPSADKVIQSAGSVRRPMAKRTSMWKCIGAVLKDIEFLKTLLLVGLLSKIAIAGVIMFALPLLLTRYGMDTERIGQLLMVYYVTSIVATSMASAVVDKVGTAKPVLFLSALVGGFAIVAVGVLLQHTPTPSASLWTAVGLDVVLGYLHQFSALLATVTTESNAVYWITLCIALAGISNGLIAAPLLSHISSTAVTRTYGNKIVATTYVFLERGGHVLGPLLIYEILVRFDQSPLGLSVFGLLIIFTGLLFLLLARSLKASKIVLLMRSTKPVTLQPS